MDTKKDFSESIKKLRDYHFWFPLSKIGRRTKAVVICSRGLKAGFFTFGEWIKLCFSQHQPRLLQSKYNQYLNKEITRLLRESISDDGAVSLFGRKFYAPQVNGVDNIYELSYFVEQVIGSDQYETKKFLKPDSVVIDAGANVGTFSILAGHLAPQGKVYSFEPAPETFATL